MKKKVIAFKGKKGSGKNTLANFLIGYQLRSLNIIKDFSLTDEGKLVIKFDAEDGEKEGILDMDRRDPDFELYASRQIWPYVKTYAFAEDLKEIVINLFQVDRALVYGTDDDKNTKIEHLKWENMPTPSDKEGPMTVRELLQYFGADICRKMFNQVWVDQVKKKIRDDDSLVSIVTDCRFDNEDEAIQSLYPDYDVKVVSLTRSKHKDSHDSENVVVGKNNFVLDNASMTVMESCEALLKAISEWGWN